MDTAQKNELVELLDSNVQFECPMSRYTTLRIGGSAEALCEIGKVEILSQLMLFLSERRIPHEIIGRGSNILVKDGGIEGVVILLKDSLASVETISGSGSMIKIGGGCHIKEVLNFCRENSLGGIEFLAGIPGTIGGAVAMNAGAFGNEIGDRIVKVEILDHNGEIKSLDRHDLNFIYRSCSIGRGNIIVKCFLKLEPMTKEEHARHVGSYMKRRKGVQPIGQYSAGSVFKNPPGHYAGRLIEEVGLKGKRIGGAMISEKHANFIINSGGAKAGDVLALIALIQEQVKKITGIELEPEIKVIGR